jgi:uncharacterized membrane protein
MKEIGRFCLSAILFSAGVIHLVLPEIFNPAIFWGMEELSNIAAGFLEIMLSLLIWVRPKLGAYLTTTWFIILLPIHVYVSIEGVPILGIDSKLLLWLRTFLQLPLIWWAWKMRLKEPEN